MKKLFLSFAFTIGLFFCFSQQSAWFTVKGFLPNWNGAEISISNDNQVIHTGKVVNDIFSYSANISSPAQGLIKIKSGKTSFFIPVFLEPGTIKIRDGGNKYLVAYGTPSNDIYTELNKAFDSLTAGQKLIKFKDAIQYKRELADNFIQHHPSSVVSLQLLKDYYFLSTEADDIRYYELIQLLDSSLRKTYYGKEMFKEAQQRYSTAPGRPAPELQLKDTTGTTRPLFNTGEYTLIDFWASWCIPCRKENTKLIGLYKKYGPAGFRITSVSLDANKLAWSSALKQDKMLWLQLSELKGWESNVAIVFGVKLIPMNYLIDRDGLILAKNLHAEELDSLLEKVLKK